MIFRLKSLKKFIFTVFTILNVGVVSAQFRVDVESGAIFTQYNEARIPGDNGTLLRINEALDQKFSGHSRFRVTYTFLDRHTVSVLAAPLQLRYRGEAPYNIRFRDANIPAGSDLKVGFRFNSYRLTYRYDFLKREKILMGAGITGKVRDADITFIVPGGPSDVSTDLGIVPLINFYSLWTPKENIGLSLRWDGLIGPNGGRAFDVALFYNQKIYKNVWLKAGYRFLEGGADNDVLYTFSYFHYASIGLWITHDFLSKN